MRYYIIIIGLLVLVPIMAKGQLMKLRARVDSLVAVDQSYRQALSELYAQYYETDVGHLLKSRRAVAVMKHKIKHDTLQAEYDRKKALIMEEMSLSDAINLRAFEKIIKAYGYPGKRLVGNYEADKLLLHSNFEWIERMFPILKQEVEKKNLRKITLASAYDKFSQISGHGYLYHVLFFVDERNKLSQTIPDDLVATNKARTALGLKPIRLKKNGKRKG